MIAYTNKGFFKCKLKIYKKQIFIYVLAIEKKYHQRASKN